MSDYPFPDDEESYEAFLDVVAERAVANAGDNASDKGLPPEAVDLHVGTRLRVYVNLQIDERWSRTTPWDPADEEDAFGLASRRALKNACLERAREVAREQGYTVYVPLEEVDDE